MSKIESFLANVYETNEFYRNVAKAHNITDPTDITQYPVLTRQQLQENRYNMFSEGYKSKYFSQLLKRQFSSGTSGTPINVYWDYDDYNRSMMALWRKRLLYYHVKPNSKCVKFTLRFFKPKNFTGRVNYTFEADNVLSVNRSCLQDELTYKNLINIIEDYSPEWMYIQPSVLNKLLFYYNRFSVLPPKSIKYIESVSEMLPRSLQDQAATFWGVPVINMYGSEEVNGIAYQCPYKNMHVLDDNVFIEYFNNNGIYQINEGEAIITNLNNTAMPLIRYCQGDVVRLRNLVADTCLCGNSSPVIDVIKGRVNDCIYGNGFEINAFLLLETVEDVNNQFSDPISEYRFTYSVSLKELCCYLSISDKNQSWKMRIAEELESIFRKKTSAKANIVLKVFPFMSEQSINKKFKILEVID